MLTSINTQENNLVSKASFFESPLLAKFMSDPGLEKKLHRLSNNLGEDKLVQSITNGV